MCNSSESERNERRIDGLCQLPLEIWEVILKNLHYLDLMKAAGVCYQWRQIAKRINHERCLSLPSRLLLELIHEYKVANNYEAYPETNSNGHATPKNAEEAMDCIEREHREFLHRNSLTQSHNLKSLWQRESVDWMVLANMVRQTEMTSNSSHCEVVRQVERLTHLSAAGDFVVCVSRGHEGNNSVLRLFGVNGVELGVHNFSGRVHKVCILKCSSVISVLAVCMDRELKCYLPSSSEPTLMPLSISSLIDVDSRMCCDGTTLVISELVEDKQLAVYEVIPFIQEMRIELQLKWRIRTSSSPLFWDLWNGFVTAVLSGGHVTTYTKSGILLGESPMYKDLRYPNPTVLSHGVVFASTITSRTLLAYWHMDRERDYWLVGRSVMDEWIQRGAKEIGNISPDSPYERDISDTLTSDEVQAQSGSVCILTLAKIRIGLAVLLETTVIHYKRGLVFCGTDQGQLLVYRLFGEKQGKHPKINLCSLESKVPILYLPVATRPISRIVAFFSDSGVTVAIGDRIGKGYIVSIPNSNSL